MPNSKEGALEGAIDRGSVLKKLIRLFRTNNVIRHHFQVGGFSKPQGTARAFFKNAYSYHQSVIPGYSAYDRFARYSDYAEMEAYSVLNNALNIVADEVTQKNEDGKIIQVTSDNSEIAKTLEELYENILHLNGKNGWKMVRNLLKYGDVMYLLDITEDSGVVNMIQMPSNEVEREEGFDKDNPSAIRFRWTAKQNIEIPNAYVAHFRLDGNDMFHPYGQSFLEAARRPWRQLVLLEDAMMVYRITRAPERRVFFLDVMGVPPEDIPQVVNKFNETIKKQQVFDDQGRIDLRYGSTYSMEEDYVIPIRGNDTATRIDTLPGGQNIGDIEDIEFIRANLFSALGIPKAFLTFDQEIKSKQVLTQEDIRFARTVARIQEVIISELVKIAMIHLYVKGYRGYDLVNFNISMTNPSTVAELQKMELWRARMDLVMSAKEGVFDTTFIYKEFLKLSDEAIDKIRKGQIQDKMFQAKLLQIENAQGLMGAGMGMGGMGGGMGMPGMGMDPMGGMGGMPGDMGGADPNMMGAPAVPGVGMGMGESKDLGRRDANHRIVASRGLEGTDLTGAGDPDEDPYDMDGIRRTVTSPMGGREAVEPLSKEALNELVEGFYGEVAKQLPPNASALLPLGMSEDVLENMWPGLKENKGGVLTEDLLRNSLLEKRTEFHKAMGWEQQLENFEDEANKLIKEVLEPNK